MTFILFIILHLLLSFAFTTTRFRRQAHVTPKSYLSFMNSYKQVYAAQKSEIDGLAHRMNIGLDKLMEASRSVGELSKELAVKEKELAVASVKADTVLKEVTQKAHAAEKVKSQVQVVKDRAQSIVDVIGVKILLRIYQVIVCLYILVYWCNKNSKQISVKLWKLTQEIRN